MADVAGRLGLRVGAPFEPGGRSAYVLPARTGSGAPVVVKVRWRHFEAEDEAAGLRAWNGAGAVRLIDHVAVDDVTDVLIVESCRPGTSAALLPGYEQDVLIAGLLRRLWVTPPRDLFRPLAAMCAAWADGLDERRAAAALGDPGLVRAGCDLFRDLGRGSAEPDVLLATDLHADNVLAAGREPWLMIDPKPYAGDRTYDALQHLLNRRDDVLADPHGMVRRMARLLDLDAERLTLWLFARCVVECDEQSELAPLAVRLRP